MRLRAITSLASHSVSKRPIWLAEVAGRSILSRPTMARIAGSQASRLLAEVMIAAGTDAQQLRPPAARVLSRHQPDPGGEVPAAAELACVADAGDQGRGNDGGPLLASKPPVSPAVGRAVTPLRTFPASKSDTHAAPDKYSL